MKLVAESLIETNLNVQNASPILVIIPTMLRVLG